jgi:hypothetical protein
VSIIVQRPQYTKNAYSHAESFSHRERFLKTTASLSNLFPPCLYYPANYGRFSVCFLSPGVSYPPVSTVVLFVRCLLSLLVVVLRPRSRCLLSSTAWTPCLRHIWSSSHLSSTLLLPAAMLSSEGIMWAAAHPLSRHYRTSGEEDNMCLCQSP